jgi:hypothetical protein
VKEFISHFSHPYPQNRLVVQCQDFEQSSFFQARLGASWRPIHFTLHPAAIHTRASLYRQIAINQKSHFSIHFALPALPPFCAAAGGERRYSKQQFGLAVCVLCVSYRSDLCTSAAAAATAPSLDISGAGRLDLLLSAANLSKRRAWPGFAAPGMQQKRGEKEM